MKQKILIGTLVIVSILILLPITAAAESNTGEKTILKRTILEIRQQWKQQKETTGLESVLIFIPIVLVILLILWVTGTSAGNPFGAPPCPFVPPPPS